MREHQTDRDVHARGRSHWDLDTKLTRFCLLSKARLPLPGEKYEEVVILSVTSGFSYFLYYSYPLSLNCPGSYPDHCG